MLGWAVDVVFVLSWVLGRKSSKLRWRRCKSSMDAAYDGMPCQLLGLADSAVSGFAGSTRADGAGFPLAANQEPTSKQ